MVGSLLGLLVSGGFILKGVVFIAPIFKAGDCVAWKWDRPPERWEHLGKFRFSRKILEVGTYQYRTQYWFGTDSEGDSLASKQLESGSESIVSMEHYWTKINCQTLEEVK